MAFLYSDILVSEFPDLFCLLLNSTFGSNEGFAHKGFSPRPKCTASVALRTVPWGVWSCDFLARMLEHSAFPHREQQTLSSRPCLLCLMKIRAGTLRTTSTSFVRIPRRWTVTTLSFMSQTSWAVSRARSPLCPSTSHSLVKVWLCLEADVDENWLTSQLHLHPGIWWRNYIKGDIMTIFS